MPRSLGLSAALSLLALCLLAAPVGMDSAAHLAPIALAQTTSPTPTSGMESDSASAPLAAVLSPCLHAPGWPPPPRVTPVNETVVPLFQAGVAGVRTSRSYAGAVSVLVSGVGQAAGTQCSDAFYLYTNSSGRRVHPWYAGGWNLFIYGSPAVNTIGQVPPYHDPHVYSFTFNALGGPIPYAAGDILTNDNTGYYVVTTTTSEVSLLAPFNQHVGFTVTRGYHTQSGASCDPRGTDDHCNTQLFALDLRPDLESDREVLAPAKGTVDWIDRATGCVGLALDDSATLTVCHVNTHNLSVGDAVARGKVLGARRSSEVHLSLDFRGEGQPFKPLAFNGAHTLEGMVLDPDLNGESVHYASYIFRVQPRQFEGLRGVSTNQAVQ